VTRISLHGDLSDLIDDLKTIKREARPRMRNVVREGVKAGTVLAKDNAQRSAGRHGKWYPKAITGEMSASLFGAAGLIAGEYGPERGRMQGEMSFEYGSRNQKPHLDLARSADVIGPSFAQEARQLLDELFWPGAK
jgi:hypothetical protein